MSLIGFDFEMTPVMSAREHQSFTLSFEKQLAAHLSIIFQNVYIMCIWSRELIRLKPLDHPDRAFEYFDF